MALVERTGISLSGNPNRVLCRLFIPGEEELIRGTSRARQLVERVMALTDDQVDTALADTLRRFSTRHPDLEHHLETHYAAVAGLVDHTLEVSRDRQRLIGALLTQEYAFESTAYFNPSVVPHPDQTGVPHGYLRYQLRGRIAWLRKLARWLAERLLD